MSILSNRFRNLGFPSGVLPPSPNPSIDPEPPKALLARCPMFEKTPLVNSPELSKNLGVSAVWVKDERNRIGLGSFKALGAAYVIAERANSQSAPISETSLTGLTFVTASAGNHGMSVAAGAQIFGARSVVFISESVPEAFAERLRARDCKVERVGADYEASMRAAQEAADKNGWILLSDTSWDGYTEIPHQLMQGYLVMAEEAVRQINIPPTHIFLQAGVGGLAASAAAYFRKAWGDGPVIVVVEPTAAPALMDSIKAGQMSDAQGPVSNMGRLDCKTPSLIALKGLARDADFFVTVEDDAASSAANDLTASGFSTTPSGAAGFAGAQSGFEELNLTGDARVLIVVSEGDEAA